MSTRAAIQSNHSKMVIIEAKAGEMDNNTIRGADTGTGRYRKDRINIVRREEGCPVKFINQITKTFLP